MATVKMSAGTKWLVSAIAALLFLIISAPLTYKLTDKVTNLMGFNTTDGGGASIYGLLIHTVVFFLVLRLILIWV